MTAGGVSIGLRGSPSGNGVIVVRYHAAASNVYRSLTLEAAAVHSTSTSIPEGNLIIRIPVSRIKAT